LFPSYHSLLYILPFYLSSTLPYFCLSLLPSLFPLFLSPSLYDSFY
jgi:hypothetical protein